MSAPEQLLTIDQLAEMCQVSRRTVEKWNRQKTGPASVRIGKYTRYEPTDVRTWLETRKSA